MAMTITQMQSIENESFNRAQARLLATGYLDEIGEEGFVPNASLDALVQLAAMLIENAQNNLNSNQQVSTGELSDSFKVSDPKSTNNVISLNVEAAFYYDFQNSGVKGTRGGSSKKGYSFKNENPSEKMVAAIRDWMKRAGLSTSNVLHSISKLEEKNKSISNMDAAYAAARGIKIAGIKGTGYFDKAVAVAQGYASEVLGKALYIDTVNSIPKTWSAPQQNA